MRSESDSTASLAISAGDRALDTSGWDHRVRRLYTYWQGLCEAGGGLPRRRDMDPLDIADILRWVWMVDVQHDPLRFKFRLFGTAHVETMGTERTGQWIDEAFPGFPTSAGYADYVTVAEDLKPSYRKGPAHYHVPDYKTIERIMLPMVDDDGRGEIILALTVYC